MMNNKFNRICVKMDKEFWMITEKIITLYTVILDGKSLGIYYENKGSADFVLKQNLSYDREEYSQRMKVKKVTLNLEDLYYIGDHPEDGKIWELVKRS